MTRHIAWSLVVLAVLIGTILRFSGIESKSLWGDEIISLAFATGHSWYPSQEKAEAVYNAEYYRASLSLAPMYFSQRLVELLRTDSQPPLYYFFLNLWLHLFGTSESALRSLSVIASVVSIPVLYTLGCHLSSVRVGVYSALIFSVAPFQLAFAQYNRPYALLGFFALLSTLAAVRLYRGEGGCRWLLIYAIATSLGSYTHYLFIWNVVFHLILVSFSRRNNPGFLIRWGLAHVCVGGAFFPWAPVFFEQLHWSREVTSQTWFYWHSGVLSFFDAILYLGRDLALLLSVGKVQRLCSSLAGGHECRMDVILTGVFYTVPILVLSFCAWQFRVDFRLPSQQESRFPSAWVTCLLWSLSIFGGPLAIDMVLNSHSVKIHRYFISASGPVYLAVALAFATVAHRRFSVWMVSGFLVFLLAGSALHLLGFSETLIYEQEAREAARHLDRSATDNDLVVVLNPGPNPMDLAYYLQSNPDFARLNIPERLHSSSDISAQLQRLTTGRKRVWYLDDRGPEIRARSVTLAWLRNHYQEIEARGFKNLDLFLFSSP